jgi:hypothetical protein
MGMSRKIDASTAREYRALMSDADALMDTADEAARRGDSATERRAMEAVERLHDAAAKI